MKIRKTISIILLVLVVITLPLSLLVFNTNMQVFSQDNLSDLLMDSAISNEALPERIREAVWFQYWYGEGLDEMPRFLLHGVPNAKYSELVGIVMGERDRAALVKDATAALFTWLDNDAPYPNLVINTGAIVSEVEANTNKIGLWVYNSLPTPGCKEEVNANYEKGEFPEDMMALISCKPPIALRPAAGEHLGDYIGEMIAEAPVPESIDVGAQLASNMDEESALAAKGQLNRLRRMTRILWILPVFLLIIGLALLGRDRKTLLTWAGWPLFISGLVGIILASRLASPTLILENAFMPPPAAMPAPAAPIVMAILGQLLLNVGSALLWQMGIVLVLGLGLLIYVYQTAIIRFFSKAGATLEKWLRLKPQGV